MSELARVGTIVTAAFTPVLAKHSKSFSLLNAISVGVDRMQRNFEPMRKQVEARRQSELTDVTAKIIIYQAFIGARAGRAEPIGASRKMRAVDSPVYSRVG